jgi:hypothetical protein
MRWPLIVFLFFFMRSSVCENVEIIHSTTCDRIFQEQLQNVIERMKVEGHALKTIFLSKTPSSCIAQANFEEKKEIKIKIKMNKIKNKTCDKSI